MEEVCQAGVVLLFKKGDAENLDNYRSSLNTPTGMFRHFYSLKNWLQENF